MPTLEIVKEQVTAAEEKLGHRHFLAASGLVFHFSQFCMGQELYYEVVEHCDRKAWRNPGDGQEVFLMTPADEKEFETLMPAGSSLCGCFEMTKGKNF